MRTMIEGRKTLLALAVSSVMVGSTGAMAEDFVVRDPILDQSGAQQILATEKILGDTFAIKVTNGNKTGSITNHGWIEAQNGAAIIVEQGGDIGYINNYGTIKGGIVGDEQIAVDLRGQIGSTTTEAIRNYGGTIEGNVYLNATDFSNKKENGDIIASSYVFFYQGGVSNKHVFDGKLIANAARVALMSSDNEFSHLVLKAQDETIVFDLVDYFDTIKDSDGNVIEVIEKNGNFTLQSGTTLEMELDGSLPDNSVVLQVNGDVSFIGNNSLVVTGELDQIAGEHTLIAADSIDGFTENMLQSTMFYDVKLIESEDGTIKVDVTYKETLLPEQLVDAAAANGADLTEQAVLGAFANIAKENTQTTPDTITFTSSAHDELANLLAVPDQQAAQLAGELTPDRSGATLHAAQRAQSKQFDAISNRLNSLRADQFHAVNAASSGLWMRVQGNDAKKNVGSRIDGYDVQGMGFNFGIDGDLTESIVAGFSFGQSYQDIDTITYDTNHEVNTYQFSAYSLWNHDKYFATGSLNAGVDYYDSYRTIGEGRTGVSEYRANGEYKAFHYGVRVTAGMDLAYDNLLLQPIIAGELNNVSIEAYDESGSVASLSYDKQSVSQVKLGAGFNMSTTYEVGPGILAPHFTAMGWYDFNADDHNIAGSIILDPSVSGEISTATGSTEVQLNLAAGFDYTIDGGLSLGLGLQHDFVDDGHDTQLQARMNYAF